MRASRRAACLIGKVGLWASVASLAYWAATDFLVAATYFGDRVAVAFDEGYFALYWGGPEADQNSDVLNNFRWPHLPGRGSGIDWTLERWGRWVVYGPELLLSHSELEYRCTYPRRFGFYAPGLGEERGVWYVGIPSWCVLGVGLVAWGGSKVRRLTLGRCGCCGYELQGLAAGAPCPECGQEPRLE